MMNTHPHAWMQGLAANPTCRKKTVFHDMPLSNRNAKRIARKLAKKKGAKP